MKIRTKLNTEFTFVTWWGVFRALKQVKVTGKVTSYNTRFTCVHCSGVEASERLGREDIKRSSCVK